MSRLPALLLLLLLASCATDDGWIPLFDGETLNGWTPVENPESWSVQDGVLVTNGERSHLFYTGNVKDHDFTNFEFETEVKTLPGSNSGIYFHTRLQETGWPSQGHEAQVLNSSPDGPGYVEHKMTGSLYAIRNLWKSPARDNEWFRYRIRVEGRTIRIWINDILTADYTEPIDVVRPEGMEQRVLGSGTFALQGHDPQSTISYRNVQVKPLPDGLPTPGSPPDNRDLETSLIAVGSANIPMMDLHVHLKEGLTMDAALANARRYGFSYGIAVNGGLGMGIETDDSLNAWLDSYRKPPHTWVALQGEGREWVDLFAPATVARFDYVFTDAMTWTNDAGRRMRLWLPEETEVGDQQDFMRQLVDRTERIIRTEPIDVFVNPTFLPDEIADRYDELWTPARMDRVIAALVESGVALEINNRRMIPSEAFIMRARDAGVRFTLGTNNAGPDDLEALEYGLAMIQAVGLTDQDMWFPE